MTRLVKGPGTDVLEREYVYSDPPLSITDLAEKHGLARSNVAAKANAGKWYEKRQEWQRRLKDETRNALAEKWAESQVALYERLAKTATVYLDKFDKALDAGEVKVNTRDMIAIAAMMRTISTDMADRPVSSPSPDDDDDTFEGTVEDAKAVIERIKALQSGAVDGE